MENSRWLAYLPSLYAEDPWHADDPLYADIPFMSRLLLIFESIWAPLDRQIDQLYACFDPRLAPPEFLPWLGTWVDLVLDENWPEARRRALIQNAGDLYRRRGTKGALRDYLKIYLGIPLEKDGPQGDPGTRREMVEDGPVKIVEDGPDGDPFHFSVTIRVKDPEAFDQDPVRRIIEEEKPAHTHYTLYVEKI